MVAEKNFEWYMGEDLTFDVYYSVDGTAQDMSQFEVRMDIAPADGNGRPVVSLNSHDFYGDLDKPGAEDNEIFIPETVELNDNGRIRIKVDKSVTLNHLKPRDTQSAFAYDLFLRDKETQEQRVLLRGTILVTRAVTQWH